MKGSGCSRLPLFLLAPIFLSPSQFFLSLCVVLWPIQRPLRLPRSTHAPHGPRETGEQSTSVDMMTTVVSFSEGAPPRAQATLGGRGFPGPPGMVDSASRRPSRKGGVGPERQMQVLISAMLPLPLFCGPGACVQSAGARSAAPPKISHCRAGQGARGVRRPACPGGVSPVGLLRGPGRRAVRGGQPRDGQSPRSHPEFVLTRRAQTPP